MRPLPYSFFLAKCPNLLLFSGDEGKDSDSDSVSSSSSACSKSIPDLGSSHNNPGHSSACNYVMGTGLIWPWGMTNFHFSLCVGVIGFFIFWLVLLLRIYLPDEYWVDEEEEAAAEAAAEAEEAAAEAAEAAEAAAEAEQALFAEGDTGEYFIAHLVFGIFLKVAFHSFTLFRVLAERASLLSSECFYGGTRNEEMEYLHTTRSTIFLKAVSAGLHNTTYEAKKRRIDMRKVCQG